MTRNQHSVAVRKTVFFMGMTVVIAVIFFVIVLPLTARIFELIPRKSSSSSSDTAGFPPQTPILLPLPEATNSAQLSISGYGEAGTTITLMNNDQKVQAIEVDKDGTFVFSHMSLSDGENRLIVVSKSAGGESKSVMQTVIIDTKPPDLTISEPSDGATITRKRDQVITIKGQTEPKARVLVNDKLVFVDNAGNFNGTYQLVEGDNSLKVIAVDSAGNQTEKELKVAFRP